MNVDGILSPKSKILHFELELHNLLKPTFGLFMMEEKL